MTSTSWRGVSPAQQHLVSILFSQYSMFYGGIQTLCSATSEFFAYFDPSNAGTVAQAIDGLIEYINSEGPFDGVMGFSQGAALAAMLLLQPSASATPLFSFAVFICAGVPLCEMSARKGVMRLLDPEVDMGRIAIPTAHIVGSKDENIAFSMTLAELCLENMRVVYDHGARHEIPFQPRVTKEMASCIEEVIRKAIFLQ
ncbi:uncharacterized protein N7459_001741 [Penicillium hispanicum]|uniref:uncharacterized protein n=1 Tax=Penicillium hispanicum TaxID=1080232 RepID=UPI0025411AC2|nr:uncharacterized protein N7459_001741 [Penicillium hispanicum]KAJ5595533.1 hypothetical protein N7459_001741 [Penicillium hispanicum]